VAAGSTPAPGSNFEVNLANTKTGKTKGRKIGRNKTFCENYKRTKRREHNKGRRLVKYLRKHPQDLVARKALRKISGIVPGFNHFLTELQAA